MVGSNGLIGLDGRGMREGMGRGRGRGEDGSRH